MFYIPILKSTERFEFALEKCVELGIINFKIFSSVKSHKRGIKIDRWKNFISAMKQSLQSHLPKMEFVKIISKDLENSVNIIFDQNAEYKFTSYLNNYKNEENRNKIINLFLDPKPV